MQSVEDYVLWKKTMTEAQAFKFMGLHHLDTERLESKKGAEGALCVIYPIESNEHRLDNLVCQHSSPGLGIAYLEKAYSTMNDLSLNVLNNIHILVYLFLIELGH